MPGRDTVQEIKAKLSIVDVVSPYVKLTKAGKHWRGLSPFNKEKTPSFFVSPDRGSFYCFSSGQGGDMFTFVEKMEGVDFKGALKILAEKAGVEIVYDGVPREDRSRTDRLREALSRAADSYARRLDPAGAAHAYALSRGLTPETIAAWQLGYAPDAWRTILEELAAAGFTTEELLASGLIKEADGKPGTYYDRFRNRLMFPIRDAAGRTVAFTGRALAKDEQAKYLNSPETELYHKSEILFGMDRAKDAIRTRGFALLVEGQMDLLHCHQAGFANTVALSGTALTERHLSLIKRYAENLMLVLDSDRAGLAATAKSAKLALSAGMRVKAVMLPEGADPADLITKDAADFAKRVADAQPVVEFFLSILAAREPDPHRLVLSVEKIVLPLIAAIESPLEREHFITVTARALASTPDAVRASLARIASEPSVAPRDSRIPQSAPSQAKSVVEMRAQSLAALAASYPDGALAQRIKDEYARIIGGDPLPEPSERAVFEAGMVYGESPDIGVADDLIRAFEKAVLDERYAQAIARLRRAQVAHDTAEEAQAERECQALLKQLAVLA